MAEIVSIPFDTFDALDDFYVLLDAHSAVLDANKSALKTLCCSKAEMLGKEFDTFLHPGSLLTFEREFAICSGEHSKRILRARLQAPNTDFLETEMRIVPFHFCGRKRKGGFLIVMHDVTSEQKKDIELLRFSYIAEHTVNPLQVTDLTGKMIYVNPAFEEYSGYHRDELIGKNPSIFSSKKHPKAFWDTVWSTIMSGNVWFGEVENKRHNGESIHSQLLVSPIMNDEKKVIGYFAVHRDLSQQRFLEKQLLHTQKMESIGTLAAGVAHEVGNPLASISALVQVLQRRSPDEFAKEKLEIIKKQVVRISKIIRDLVDFSRPSNYELKLTDINKSMQEAVDIIHVGTKAKAISFDVALDDSISLLPLVPDQIQQVYVNILINSVDAIHEQAARLEGKEYSGKIIIRSFEEEGHVVTTIEDNGVGLDESLTTKIFEPFFTTKKEGKGTGLGLWVSYGIIKSFKGQIKAEITENGSVRFAILLPTQPTY